MHDLEVVAINDFHAIMYGWDDLLQHLGVTRRNDSSCYQQTFAKGARNTWNVLVQYNGRATNATPAIKRIRVKYSPMAEWSTIWSKTQKGERTHPSTSLTYHYLTDKQAESLVEPLYEHLQKLRDARARRALRPEDFPPDPFDHEFDDDLEEFDELDPLDDVAFVTDSDDRFDIEV